MKRNKIAIALLLSTPCFASANEGIYLGIGAGYSMLKDACVSSSDCRDNHVAANMHLGYDFNEYVAAEFNTDYLGEFTVNSLNQNKLRSSDISLWSLGLAPKISLPLTNTLGLYSKLGGAYMMAGDETDIVTTASVGSEYKLSKTSKLQLEYQRFQDMSSKSIDSMDVNLVSLRFNYQFGAKEDVIETTPPVVETRPTTRIVSHYYPAQTDRLNFDFDSYQVGVTETLDKSVEILEKYSNSVVDVTGHTDALGSEQYNQSLSEKRAQFIADELTSRGINNDRITVHGAGESQPISTNETEQGRSENRRVEITIPAFEYQERITETVE